MGSWFNSWGGVDVNQDGVVNEADTHAQMSDDPGWFGSINRNVNDPTGLEQSKYDFNYRVFPEDLTQSDSSHYMVININVPVHAGGARRSSYPVGTILDNEYSKVDNLRFNKQLNESFNQDIGAIDAVNGEFMALPRSTRRIAESIALAMPNGGLVYTEDNEYEAASLAAMANGLVAGGLNMFDKKTLGGIPAMVGNIYDAVGSLVKNGAKITGNPINPRVEVLFTTRPQRQWVFEVFLAPRSQSEATTAKKIVDTLRYHAAPELGNGGFYFIPPAEFDITFFRQGVENLNLPRINTCVLERIEMDYAPQGGIYSTFTDGSPVAIRLTLGFREIEINHKRRILQGF